MKIAKCISFISIRIFLTSERSERFQENKIAFKNFSPLSVSAKKDSRWKEKFSKDEEMSIDNLVRYRYCFALLFVLLGVLWVVVQISKHRRACRFSWEKERVGISRAEKIGLKIMGTTRLQLWLAAGSWLASVLMQLVALS